MYSGEDGALGSAGAESKNATDGIFYVLFIMFLRAEYTMVVKIFAFVIF